MGIVSPNAHGLDEYEQSLRNGRSGIRFIPELKSLNFACQIGGLPQNFDDIRRSYFNDEELMSMNENIGYASVCAVDAWRDAGFEVPDADSDQVNWDTGVMVGSGVGGLDSLSYLVPMVNEGKVRRLGSRIVEQVMNSGGSARIAGLLALGNQATSISSACNTGCESLIAAFNRIRGGLAKRMLAGGSEGAFPYVWSGFDAMHLMCRKFNHKPEAASRPMSASASGFVPGSGGGILVLEDLQTALDRGARIYAELIGGAVNCGGHRMGGSITAPNQTAIIRCIRDAIANAMITPSQIDAINGHLTATFADPLEVKSWEEALRCKPGDFPLINATKSLIGHCLGAAGAMECIATVLQIYKGFLHPSMNCEDIHPDIIAYEDKIPRTSLDFPKLEIIAKASFGFGDVNSCVVFKKWRD